MLSGEMIILIIFVLDSLLYLVEPYGDRNTFLMLLHVKKKV
jgi:hypothetical protein